jgi:hypothetical protein
VCFLAFVSFLANFKKLHFVDLHQSSFEATHVHIQVMSYRTSTPSQFGASGVVEPAVASSSSSSSSMSNFSTASSDLTQISSQSVPNLRKTTRDLERRLGESIDVCSSSMETAAFDVVHRQLRDTQSLLDHVR